MLRNLLSLFLIGVALLSTSVARAQQPDSPDQVKALLTGKGYSVVEVANYPDESGSPRTDTVYAMMEASNLDLDSDDMAQQVTWGMVALHKYYPRVENLLVLMKSSKYLVYFSSTASTLATAAASDPDTEVKKSAVFGLSRMPNGEGVTRLIDTGVDIDRVARLSGFASAAYFCRVFREETGMSPGVFRRRNLLWLSGAVLIVVALFAWRSLTGMKHVTEAVTVFLTDSTENLIYYRAPQSRWNAQLAQR